MSTAEAKRHDLYNALTEFIGPDRADTLMAYLPSSETADLATRFDVETLAGRFDHLENRIDRLEMRIDHLETRLDTGLARVGQRLDRLFITLTAGLIAIVATVFAQAIL